MYPDFKGEGTISGFPGRIRKALHEAARDAIIIPIFNGLSKSELEQLVQQPHGMDVERVGCEQKGLTSTLMRGYQYCLEQHPNSTIVRLDTAEHNPDYILQLARSAQEESALIVGDLSFEKGKLVENSADELIHLGIFPQLYEQFCGVRVSCAHGYQAVNSKVIKPVYEGAIRIVQEVTSEIGQTPRGGFDGAMILSASYQNIPVIISKVPAETVRNRPTAKIMDQFGKHLRMCRAAERIFRK